MKRLREWLDSIVFAGIKPVGRPGQTQDLRWLGPLREPVERWLSGSKPTDPLYLSNRTLGQKVKRWSVVAIPCVLIMGFVALLLSKSFFASPEGRPQREISADELTRKILPNVARNIKIESNKDIDIAEVRIDRSGQVQLTGTVRNNSSHAIGKIEMVFNLTDKFGSQLGAVSGRVEDLAPQTTRKFQFPIEQQDAAFALVRDVSTPR